MVAGVATAASAAAWASACSLAALESLTALVWSAMAWVALSSFLALSVAWRMVAALSLSVLAPASVGQEGIVCLLSLACLALVLSLLVSPSVAVVTAWMTLASETSPAGVSLTCLVAVALVLSSCLIALWCALVALVQSARARGVGHLTVDHDAPDDEGHDGDGDKQ